jgi:ribosome-binding ATPase YchF (GTP1/OBG family)
MVDVIQKCVQAGMVIIVIICMNAWMASAQDDITTVLQVIENQRKAYIERAMALTQQENETFWPLYAEYEEGLSKIRGELFELMAHFVERQGGLSDVEAVEMLNRSLKIDFDELKFKQAYVAKFMQVLPGRKVVRFYQVENRFDTAAVSELYKNIPLIR